MISMVPSIEAASTMMQYVYLLCYLQPLGQWVEMPCNPLQWRLSNDNAHNSTHRVTPSQQHQRSTTGAAVRNNAPSDTSTERAARLKTAPAPSTFDFRSSNTGGTAGYSETAGYYYSGVSAIADAPSNTVRVLVPDLEAELAENRGLLQYR